MVNVMFISPPEQRKRPCTSPKALPAQSPQIYPPKHRGFPTRLKTPGNNANRYAYRSPGETPPLALILGTVCKPGNLKSEGAIILLAQQQGSHPHVPQIQEPKTTECQNRKERGDQVQPLSLQMRRLKPRTHKKRFLPSLEANRWLSSPPLGQPLGQKPGGHLLLSLSPKPLLRLGHPASTEMGEASESLQPPHPRPHA